MRTIRQFLMVPGIQLELRQDRRWWALVAGCEAPLVVGHGHVSIRVSDAEGPDNSRLCISSLDGDSVVDAVMESDRWFRWSVIHGVMAS